MAHDAQRPAADAIQRLFELSLDMLGTAKDGYFTELNPAWEQWLGWTRAELMAEPFISFVHPDDVEATLDRATLLAAPGRDAVVTFENRYRTRAGDYRVLNWTTVAVDGVLYFAAKDVTEARAGETERREAELLIRDSEALHRTLTANLPDTSVFLLDHELRVLIADGEAIRRLGFLDETMFRGRRVADLYAELPDARPQALPRQLPRRARQGRAADVRVHQRGPDVRRPGGARPRRRTAPSSPCSSSPATSPSAPMPRSRSRATPASRTPSRRSVASRWGATTSAS